MQTIKRDPHQVESALARTIMVSPTKLARMDAKVRTFLAKEFATAPNYQAHVLQLWDRYRDLGLPKGTSLKRINR